MTKKLKNWIKRINEADLPIFGHTMKTIQQMSPENAISASELANIILKDSSLTAKILKLANSSLYNPSEVAVNTISRAVVLLGFNFVHDLILSLAIIDDALQNKKTHGIISRLFARSLHAAVQSDSIARKRGDKPEEEFFIASLLYHLGEIAFWVLADKQAEELLSAGKKEDISRPAIQRKILGFTFSELTAQLAKNWNLSNLLYSALTDETGNTPKSRTLHISHELALVSEGGWDKKEADATFKKLAKHIGMHEALVMEMAYQNTETAMKIAVDFGVGDGAECILLPGQHPHKGGERQDTGKSTPEDAASPYPEPNPLLQLKILHELSSILESNPDINLILEAVLEGIHRGVGMDRAILFLLDEKNNQIRNIYTIGENLKKLPRNYILPLEPRLQNPFAEAFDQEKTLWIKNFSKNSKCSASLKDELARILSVEEFFIAPIITHNHALGLFYGDRQPSNRPLDEMSFESFKYFSLQACMSIEHIGFKKKK